MKKSLYIFLLFAFMNNLMAQNPAVELTKDDQLPYTPQNLAVGDVITYILSITNTGNIDLTGINIDDAQAVLTNNFISNLSVGQQASITATHVVTQADINTGYICNSATATFTYNGQTYTDISDDTDPASPAGNDDCTMTFLVSPSPNDHDNDTIYDDADLDDDNDGIPDIIESNGIDPLTDNDGDGVPVYLDDNDNDNSIGDDNGQVESAFDTDADGTPNHFDLDSDGDTLYDTAESGRLNIPVGTDADLNGILEGNVGVNGLVDEVETSPDSGNLAYNLQDSEADGIYDFLDQDDDNDNVPTIYEHPDLYNNNGYPDDAMNSDADSIPNYLDVDDDGDSIYTIYEDVELPHNYPQDGNPMNDDTDNDGIPNYLDQDDDNDGCLTMYEHPDNNGNGEPDDAIDSNLNGIPDYLDYTTTLPITINISSNNSNPDLLPGETITYQINIENTGNLDLNNVEIYCDNALIQGNSTLDLAAGQNQSLTAYHIVTTADIVAGQASCQAFARTMQNGQTTVYRSDADTANSVPDEVLKLTLNNNLVYPNYWNNHIAYDIINDVAHTADANWLATGVGLAKFDKSTQTFSYFSKADFNLWAGQIYAVAYEENTGLLWIGTDQGLFIYDGNNFSNYQSANSVFPDKVFDIFIDDDNTKWIGGENGLIKWDANDNIEVYNTANSNIPFDYIKAITQTEDGKLWIASLENLAGYDGTDWEFIDGQSIFDYNPVKYIIPYHNNVLIQSEQTSFLYWTENDYFEDLNPITTCGNTPLAIAVDVDENDNIWLGRTDGIIVLNFTTTPPDISNLPVNNEPVYFISIDENNDKWINTTAQLNKYDDINYDSYPMSSHGLLTNKIYSLCVDHTGKPWIASEDKLQDLENGEWQTHYQTGLDPYYEHYSFESITAGSNNEIWATAWGTYELIYYKDDVFYTGLSSYVVNPTSVSIDSNQNTWIGDANGLHKYNGNSWTHYTSSNSNIPNSKVQLMAINANDEIWYINRDNQLVHFVNGNATGVYDYNNSILPDDLLTCITIDSSNRIWVGSRNQGVFSFDGSNWNVYNTGNSGLPDDRILSIKAHDNDIWIGSYEGGLTKLSGNDFYTYHTGNSLLQRNRINQIDIDHQYNIWVGTHGGGITKFNETGLGIEENNKADNQGIMLYPNPAQNNIRISVKNGIAVLEVSVYSLSGQLILQNKSENKDDLSIDIHQLNKGIYLIKIKTDTGTYRQKFIKN